MVLAPRRPRTPNRVLFFSILSTSSKKLIKGADTITVLRKLYKLVCYFQLVESGYG
jgi:hypothetical protein